MNVIQPIATEAGHWYIPNPDFTAQTFYEVAYADKAKAGQMRPTTKKDAKKVGAVPGVTTICKCWKNYQLMKWLENRALEFGYASSAMPNIEAVREAFAIEADKPAQRGKDVHGIVERGSSKQPMKDPEDVAIFKTFAHGIEALGIRLIVDFAERAFAMPAQYGCRLDGLALTPDGLSVVDFKTLESVDKKRKPYPAEMMQIAANRTLVNLHCQHVGRGEVNFGALIYLSPQGQVISHEPFDVPALAPWQRKFEALLAAWKIMEEME